MPLLFPYQGVLPDDERPTYGCSDNWQQALLLLGRLPRSTAFVGSGSDDVLQAAGFRTIIGQDHLIELARLGYISGLRWTAANERVLQQYEAAVREFNQAVGEARDLYMGSAPERPVYEPLVEESGVRVTDSGWAALAVILSTWHPSIPVRFDEELCQAWNSIELAMREQVGGVNSGDILIGAYCDHVASAVRPTVDGWRGPEAFASLMRDELCALLHYIRSEKSVPVAAEDCGALLVHLACVLCSVRSTADQH